MIAANYGSDGIMAGMAREANTPDTIVADLAEWREERDEFFRSHYASPLPESDVESFPGLAYFAPNPDLVLHGQFTSAEGTIEIGSSSGGSMGYPLAGYVELGFGSETYRLVVLQDDDDDLLIPFRDATSGSESYGGGRYAPAVRQGSSEVTVDFNRAVNPYCAYDEEFSCPLPPAENWLRVPVEAGEKNYVVD